MNVGVLGDWQGGSNGKNVKELIVHLAKDVSSFDYGGGLLYNVVFKPEAELTKFDFATDSCVFVENEEPNVHGIKYMPLIGFELPRPDSVVFEFFEKYKYKRFGVFFRDGNDTWWWCGSDLMIFKTNKVGGKTGLGIGFEGSRRMATLRCADGLISDVISGSEFGDEFGSDFYI